MIVLRIVTVIASIAAAVLCTYCLRQKQPATAFRFGCLAIIGIILVVGTYV